MVDLATLAQSNPQKLEELAAFHWFIQSLGIKCSNIRLSERPDFVMNWESKTVGVEITKAKRPPKESDYSIGQVESAQNQFAGKIQENINTQLPLGICIVFEDGVTVAREAITNSAKVIAEMINEVSKQMASHSVELLVREGSCLSGSNHKKHVCGDIPTFVQHIQLLNDGHVSTCVMGTRGTILGDYRLSDLESVLIKKHKALRGYKQCDEHWLVIVSGVIPPIWIPKIPPTFFTPSVATSFAGVTLDEPIESDFNKVYFFKSPTEVFNLTT